MAQETVGYYSLQVDTLSPASAASMSTGFTGSADSDGVLTQAFCQLRSSGSITVEVSTGADTLHTATAFTTTLDGNTNGQILVVAVALPSIPVTAGEVLGVTFICDSAQVAVTNATGEPNCWGTLLTADDATLMGGPPFGSGPDIQVSTPSAQAMQCPPCVLLTWSVPQINGADVAYPADWGISQDGVGIIHLLGEGGVLHNITNAVVFVEPDSQHTYSMTVTANDGSGASKTSDVVTVTVPSAPKAPQFSAQASPIANIVIWEQMSGADVYFVGGVGPIDGKTTTYTDTAVSPGTVYGYLVEGRNYTLARNGYFNAPSPYGTAVTPPVAGYSAGPVPVTPNRIEMDPLIGGVVDIFWEPAYDATLGQVAQPPGAGPGGVTP